ncbi:hypothetical protein AVEN_151841-1 [Araneus ventricosus]|uniref:DUF4817 domain-containing protein n=1 Tax=Araneus ventricosus TaxID=182803 RepID=A0A4Y2NEA3_ARAVE|nr:hypothetical protein AVEN_151841-1 [Araneus ventricosus]
MHTTEQYIEMILLYGQCNRIGREVAKQNAIKFPNDSHPSTNTIFNVVKRLRETGSVEKHSGPGSSNMHASEEEILGYALVYPQYSVRDISVGVCISRDSVAAQIPKYGTF